MAGNTFVMCMFCRRCKGAAYQLPPFLFSGNKLGDVLVIAQNPGEVKENDESRQYAIDVLNPFIEKLEPEEIGPNFEKMFKLWYDWDFGTSIAVKRLANVFGKGWEKKFCYTNAVRCRTPGNESPSAEMIKNCKSFTNQLIYGRKLIVFIGNVALLQWIPKETVEASEHGKSGLVYGTDPRIGNWLKLPHYVNWLKTDAVYYKEMFVKALKGGLFS